MTLHVILASADKRAFVWIADRLAGTAGGYATVEKVTYLKEFGIACSIWGDQIAMFARDNFLEQVRSGIAPLSDKGKMKLFLQDIAKATIQSHRPQDLKHPRGVLIAVLGDEPQFYALTVSWPPIATPIIDQATYGDENPALFFLHRYYEACNKTVPGLLAIGVHTVRMAELMNTKGVRGLDAWVCEGKNLRQLTERELRPYIERSKRIDSIIENEFIAEML
jgi:hypothetical protein